MEEQTDTVDGVTGQQEVADKFREVYQCLYNSAGSAEEMTNLQKKIHELIQTEDSKVEVQKLTTEVVKKAAGLMKPHKMDVSQGYSSAQRLLIKPSFQSCSVGC